MRAQRSDLPRPQSPQAARAIPHAAGATGRSDPQRDRSAPLAPVHRNSVACDHARSANSITGRVWLSGAIGVKRTLKGKSRNDPLDKLGFGPAGEHPHYARGTVAAPGRGGAASVGKDELDIRGRAHTALAVCASRPARSLHQAAVGGVGRGEHPSLRVRGVLRARTSTPRRR